MAGACGSMRRFYLFMTVLFLPLVITCELGESPIAPEVKKSTPSTTSLDNTVSLSIETGGVTLLSGKDTLFGIEAILVNGNHNPVAGEEITFTISNGVITTKDTTDDQGIARAVVRHVSSDQDKAVIVRARAVYEDSVVTASASIEVMHTVIITDSVNNNMLIRTDPSQLTAAYNEKSTVEVLVFDNSRNPVIGKEIDFTTTKGTVAASGITDSMGIARVLFYGEPVNGDATVTGKMKYNDSVIAVATTITLHGIEVIITPQLSVAPPGSKIPVVIKLLDGKGYPLPDREILVSATADSVKKTDGTGTIATVVTRANEGSVVIRAFALGSGDSTTVYFGNTAPVDVDNTIRSLRLFTSHQQLRADNSAEATVTAVIISEDNHNPLIGDTIDFSSTLGIIDGIGISDSSGRSSVTLRSAPVNGICMIRAVLRGNSAIQDSTSVLLSGVTLSLAADHQDVRVNDTATITALLKDGSGNSISSDFVNFTIRAPGWFSDQSHLAQMSLSAAGTAVIRATSAAAGKVVVHAASANVSDSIILMFTTNNLTMTGERTTLTIGGRDSTRVYATYFNAAGNPIAGKTIAFATSAGSISPSTAVTNANGRAEAYLKSGFFSTTATVQAKSADGSAYLSVDFEAATPRYISLAVTPDNIGINGGVAELVATVKDDSGNVVSDAEVAFKILKGPGGGETIDKPIIVTTNDGIARAKLLSGTLPSEYRGCEVVASVGAYSSASKLTISGEPHTVTISRPQDDSVTVPKGGVMDESTFEFFMGAVVKDVNGNPVADGTQVNFSAVVSGMSVATRKFVRFQTKDGDIEALYDYVYLDIPFEDINDNKKYDEGIDLDLDGYHTTASRGDDFDGNGTNDYEYLTDGIFYDFNGNGICDTAMIDANAEPYKFGIKIELNGDTTYERYYADLNRNGHWDANECSVSDRSRLPTAMFTSPYGYDFDYWRWEMRPHLHNQQFDFSNNDFAIIIDKTAVTKDGVAYTRLTYPRQFAHRLYATVNAEVKGLRDRNGERFILPDIK